MDMMHEQSQIPVDFWMNFPRVNYVISENDEYVVWLSGCLIGYNKKELLKLAKSVFDDKQDYNNLNGFFRICFFDKKSNKYLFFGDHSGSQYLFMDESNGCFSDSFLSLRKQRCEVLPDLRTVYELFTIGRVLGENTLVKGISKTDPEYYYCFENGKFSRHNKDLKTFSEYNEQITLEQVVKQLLCAVDGEKICAVCTGGTDSRAILAHLAHNGKNPQLVLTGHEGNPDIPIAEKLADELNCSLTMISPMKKEEDWLIKGTFFLDGLYDSVLSYRHYQKGKWVMEQNVSYEFGGVGGEFYKNDFCHLFIHPGKWKDSARLQGFFFSSDCSKAVWCGKSLKEAGERIQPDMQHYVDVGLKERNRLSCGNRIGLFLLASGSGSITHGYSRCCCKVDPLMDRRLIAAASQDRPISHSMAMWQRKEISKVFPQMSNIETDQGYSCSTKSTRLLLERMLYLKKTAGKIFEKVGVKKYNKRVGYWDLDYLQGRDRDIWRLSVEYCKNVGILADDVRDEQIPLTLTGWILLVGIVCSKNFESYYSRVKI